MDEEQLLLLKNAGFELNEIGAIVDSNGMYQESVTLNGTVIQSPAGFDEYNSYVEQKKVLEEINYSEQDNIAPSDAAAISQLEQAEKGNTTRIPMNPNQTIYESGYDAYKNKKRANKEAVHEDYEGFYDAHEPSVYKEVGQHTLKEIESDIEKLRMQGLDERADEMEANKFNLAQKNVDELKEIEAEKAYIERFHPSWEDNVKNISDESKGYILDVRGMPLKTPDKDANFLEKLNFNIQDAVGDFITNIASIPLTKTAGIEDEDAKERYKVLAKREKELKTPVAQARLKELDQMKEEINLLAGADNVSWMSSDTDALAYAEKLIDNERRRLKNYVEDAQWYEIHKHFVQLHNTLLNFDNVVDWASFGFYDAAQTYAHRAGLRKKIDNNEQLSSVDVMLGRVFAKEDEIAENGFENNFVTDAIDNTNESLKFLGFGEGGRIAAKAATKGITRAIVGATGKTAKFGLKAAKETSSTLIQTALHPGVYTNASEYYAGSFEIEGVTEDGRPIITAGWRLYESQKEENRQMLYNLDVAISRAPNIEKKIELEKLRNELQKADESLKKPATGGQALFRGVTETGKEIMSENYGGMLFRGLTNKIGFGGTKLGQKIATKYPQIAAINNMGTSSKRWLNSKMTTIPGQKLIGSNTEEFFEEILVQATPSYENYENASDFWKDYKNQVSELTDGMFYAKVGASTILMQGAMGIPGGFKRLKGQLNKDNRIKRKELKDLYKQIGNKNITQLQFNTAMMKIGEGSFSIQEYNNSIGNLREQGLIEEANEIEQNKILKQAMIAEEAGNLKGFKNALLKARYNENLDPATKANIELMIPEINNMLNVSYINRTEVIKLNSQERFIKKSQKEVETALNEVNNIELNEEFDAIKKKLGADESYNLEDYVNSPLIKDHMVNNFDKLSDNMQKFLLLQSQRQTTQEALTKLQKEIKHKTSYDHQLKLSLQQDYLKWINNMNKDLFKGKMTPTQFANLIKIKAAQKHQKSIDEKTLTALHKGTLVNLMNQQMLDIAAKTAAKDAESKKDAPVTQTQPQDTNVKQGETPVTTSQPDVTQPATTDAEVTQNIPTVKEDTLLKEDVTPDTNAEMVNIMVNLAMNEETGQTELEFPEESKKPNTNIVTNETKTDIIEDDTIDFMLSSDETVGLTTSWADAFRRKAEREPTFKDFVDAAVKAVDEGTLTKENMRQLADMFVKAELGEANWEQLYNDMYFNEEVIMKKIVNSSQSATVTEQNTAIEESNEQGNKESIEKAEPGVGVNEVTNKVIRVSPATGKTRVIDTKANFAGVKYRDKVETDANVAVITKEDVDRVPEINDKGILDIRALLRDTEIGTVWDTEVLKQSEWAAVVVLESDRDRKYITFDKWVEINKPNDMSLDEFMTTDAFISKVPILYKDKNGANVSFVADTDWYNPFNVGDPNNSDLINEDVDNILPGHQNHINTGKANALAHRKKIFSGVTQVRVTSKEAKGYDRINAVPGVPPPSLEEVGSNYPIVFWNVDRGVDLEGNPLDKDIIIDNIEQVIREASGPKSHIHANRVSILIPTAKTADGKQRYVIRKVLSKNETGQNQAFTEDIETAKNLIVAHKILAFGENYVGDKTPLNMSLAEAQAIRTQIMDVAKIDIAKINETAGLINALVKFTMPGHLFEDGKTHSATIDGKVEVKVKVGDKIEIREYPVYKLFLEGRGTVTQNTSLHPGTAQTPLRVSRKDGQVKVEKVAETYEQYLRKRLSTEIQHHNIGTAENPIWTPFLQPTILLESVEDGVPLTSVEIGEKGNAAKESKRKEATEIAENKEVIPVEAKKLMGDETLSDEAFRLLQEADQHLRDMGMIDENEVDHMLPVISDTTPIKEAISTIGTLNLKQQRAVITELLSILASTPNVDSKLSNEEFNIIVATTFENQIQSEYDSTMKIISNLQKVYAIHPTDAIKERIDSMRLLEQNIKSVIDNYNAFYTKAYAIALRQKFISPDTKTTEKLLLENKESMESDMQERNFSQSANEVIHKEKISEGLRKLFATIGTGKKGFLGLQEHEDFDVMYNTISALLVKNLPTNPDFDSMMETLEMYKEAFPWLQNFITEIKKEDSTIKNGFVVNMFKYAANAKFVIFSRHKDGVDSQVWNSNANDIIRKINERWKNNFKRNDVTNGNTLNPVKLKLLVEEFDSWGEKPWEQDPAIVRKWLSEFGIKITDNTWKDVMDGKMTTGKGKKKQNLSYRDLFVKSSNSRNKNNRLFSSLAEFARNHQNAEHGKLDYTTAGEKFHPFKEMGGILSSLNSLEATHNSELRNQTRRDGGKTVSELVFPTFFMHNVGKLIKAAHDKESTYIQELQKIAFSENSVTLKLLLENADFADIFNYAETGLESLSEQYKQSNPFAKIDEISPLDYMFHQRNQFQYLKEQTIEATVHEFKMRIATMATLTNSDKGRQMLKKTAVFQLANSVNAFEVKDDGEIVFKPDLHKLLYETMIYPELNRILHHIDDNIKGYNMGAVRFNILPEINILVGRDGSTVSEFLEATKTVADKAAVAQSFRNNFEGVTSKFLEKNIQLEVAENLKEIAPSIKDNVDTFNNKDYIASIGETGQTSQTKMKLAELDYVINAMISNVDTMQTLSGDPAMFYAGQSSKEVGELQASTDLGVNMGKRMALMIAPGLVLSNSTNEKYIQLMLKDANEVATGIEQIIGWHYGTDALNELHEGKSYSEHISDLRNKTINKETLAHLKLKFAKVADFMSIESTDAQEYTTLNEHLRVLEGLGRISEEKVAEITSRVEQGLEISEKDLETVLQPIKPVYTGDVIEKEVKDKDGNTVRSARRRIVYIKSSSFPLIPQLVKNTELEPLMNTMNELEQKEGKKVRASYQSANKVGALTNSIDPFDAESLATVFARRHDTGELANALTLDRINFKIQQDVPNKSKYTNEDTVSMGTQIFKLLFGDGIMDLEGEIFTLDGVPITAQDLQKEFFSEFAKMIGYQKTELLNKMGLDENYKSIDPLYTAQKIQELLEKEAIERDFPQNDIETLALQKTVINDNPVYHFKMPLWFSGNSNKLESMLNAIINNKIFKQKLPGYAFVVGSDKGIQIREGIENLKDNKIIHIGDYKGGELQDNEVIVASKIRLNGEIIDLFQTDKKGDYIYLNETDEGFTINDKISPELYENFSFRTPTSSHSTGANIKIVGFLPSVMGDLMITSKNFVTQMGQDFDVDKLTSYHFYHAKKDGVIERINESHREGIINKIKKVNKVGTEADKIAQELLGLFSSEELNEILQGTPDTIDEKIEKANRLFDVKLARNRFIAIHQAVYDSPSPEVQRRINKVLSMDSAKANAQGIEALSQKDVSNKPSLNLASPNYQMQKLIGGSTGNTSIGIYAKGTTFNSLTQQLPDGTIRLQEEVEGVNQDKTIRFGNIVSRGIFGLKQTLSVENANETELYFARSIAESQDERVNTGTDNEKAQVLSRTGITHRTTVAVDNLLSLLGIDNEVVEIKDAKDYDPNNPFHRKAIINGEMKYAEVHSIPYLLHSQPIIQEYFKRLKNGTRITGEFTPNLHEQIAEELLGEYVPQEGYDAKFTGKALSNQIGLTNSMESDFQKEVLIKYLGLIDDAASLKEIQETVDLSNLGKSMWEAKEAIEKFKKIASNDKFSNVDALLGTFSQVPLGTENELLIDDTPGQELYFTPTTNQGVMVGTAISLARNLFFDYFPYYDSYIDSHVEAIMDASSKTNSTQFQEHIFQEIKKFITSTNRNEVFMDIPFIERMNLFMDTDTNQSLSNYIASQLDNTDKEFEAGLGLVKNSSLLGAFDFQQGSDGKPSLIKLDNTETTNTSQEKFYDDFRELFLKDYPLPDKNGKPYSTAMLAQELVAYSHLSGGIVSQAIEFHRFIPVDYYESIMHTKLNRPVSRMLQNYDTLLMDWSRQDRLANFEKQYFQNNPGHAIQIDSKNMKNGVYINHGHESLDELPKYVSIKHQTKSKLKQHKWSVYEHLGNAVYRKIDVLGEFGMSEYDYSSSDLKTVTTAGIKKQETAPSPVVLSQQSIAPTVKPPVETPAGETAETMLARIAKNSFDYNPHLQSIAQELIKLFPNEMKDIKLIFDPNIKGAGQYQKGVIKIKPNGPRIHETFVHEFIHAVSSDYINKFYKKDINGNLIVDEFKNPILEDKVPAEITNLVIMTTEYDKNIKKMFPEEYADFYKRYKKFKNGEKTDFTHREMSIFYPTVNLKEFLAVSLSNNKDFLEVAGKMQYKQTGNSILDKFARLLDEILSKYSGVRTDLVHKALIGRSLDVLKDIHKVSKEEIEGEDLMNLDTHIRSQAVEPVVDNVKDMTKEQKLQKSLDSIKVGELNSYDMYPVTATLYNEVGGEVALIDFLDVNAEDQMWRIKQTINDYYAQVTNPAFNTAYNKLKVIPEYLGAIKQISQTAHFGSVAYKVKFDNAEIIFSSPTGAGIRIETMSMGIVELQKEIASYDMQLAEIGKLLFVNPEFNDTIDENTISLLPDCV